MTITNCPFTGQEYEEYRLQKLETAFNNAIERINECVSHDLRGCQYQELSRYARGLLDGMNIFKRSFRGLIK